MSRTKKKKHWLHEHSLSIVSILLLLGWIAGFSRTTSGRWNDFFGNSIADWSGSVVLILGTKFLYEIGSAESRPFKSRKGNRWLELLYEHSLLLFLALSGIGWLILYLSMGPQEKWGQVVGNIISEWVQMAGLVFLTKRLIERGSKESQ